MTVTAVDYTARLGAGKELDVLVAQFMGTPFRKPTHGNCCTCQVCGWDHDNCQCDYGENIEKAMIVLTAMRRMGYYISMANDGTNGKWYAALFSTKEGTWNTDGISDARLNTDDFTTNNLALVITRFAAYLAQNGIIYDHRD